MNGTLISLADQAALVLSIACVQFTLFAAMLLVPALIWRRPAWRHGLALTALCGACLAPVTAAGTLRLGLHWLPLPGWERLQETPTRPAAIEETPPQPVLLQISDPARTGSRSTDSAGPNRPLLHPSVSQLEPVDASEPNERIDLPTATASDGTLPIATSSGQGEQRQHEHSPSTIASPAVPANDPQSATDARPENTRRGAAMPGTARQWLRIGLAGWLFGVLIGCARWLRTSTRLARLLAESTPVREPSVAAIASAVSAQVGLNAPPRLSTLPTATSPFVTGLRRPRIVLPGSLLSSESESSLRHVLLHECCHVARGDLWIGTLQRAVAILWWPHPLVHVHATFLSQAREELCDDQVLASVSPIDYSRTLLRLSELASGLVPGPISFLSRRHSLAARVAGLLDPQRDRSLRLGRVQGCLLAALIFVAAAAAIGIGPSRADENAVQEPQPATAEKADASAEPRDLLVELAERSGFWLTPPPALKQLEYDYVLGTDVTPVSIKRGDRRPRGVWFGATLHTAFHKLAQSPDRFNVEAKHTDDGQTITLVATPKDEQANIAIDAGNGIEGTWRGYFSHAARESTIVVDAARLVPLQEQTGGTTFRYFEWKKVADDKWIPRQIDVIGHGMRWRMRFDWLGDAVWLLTSSESMTQERTATIACTRNLRVNGKPIGIPLTDAQKASREAAKEILAMLDHNRPWLDTGETGAGWKPPFETLSYTFHTVRQDVRETCILTRDGVALFEVTADSQGKMKDGGRRRKIALDSPHYATSQRGDRFARIFERTQRDRDQATDLALKHYARIGCQFDLPLFRYRERLDTASVSVEDGEWNGQPCRVVTVTNLGGDVPLGCGTMLAFTSWSYVHHIMPSQETLYIDPERNVVLHETLTSSRDGRTFEIDFGDYVEIEPGQWAPLSIRIEAKDYFTSEYRFQLIADRHWMLKEVVSWFERDNKSRGIVENIGIDGDRTLLDETLKQVEASQTLFSGTGEPSKQIGIATIPFVLGEPIDVGPYELLVSVADIWTVTVSASTDDPNAPGSVPLVFLDGKHRPLFAPSIVLAEKDGRRQGTVKLSGSSVWKNVRSIAVFTAGTKQVPVAVVPLEWGKMLSVNIPDINQGKIFRDYGEKEPRKARTRVFQVQADWSDERTATVALDLVSIDGPQEFRLDLSAAVLDKTGKLLATGHHSGKIRVESDPVEQHVLIELGKLPSDAEPAFLAIGVAPGDVISAPMGSLWGTFFDTYPPFDVEALLAASDDDCRRVGLASLGQNHIDRTLEEEFFENRVDEDRVGDGRWSRRTLLRPHVASLTRIVQDSQAADVKASAARFLAYVEADNAVALLKPLLDEESPAREAAAIGLTFLGQAGHLDVLGGILAAEEVSLDDGVDRSIWKAARTLERDTLIALVHNGTDAAVDLLGETLLSDLEGARLVTGENGRMHLDGRTYRAKQIITLLGKTGNPRSVDWLTKAADLIDGRDDLDEHFGASGIARSLLQFQEQAQVRIVAEIESGDDLGSWLYVIRESRDAAFLPAVRKRLAREDATAWEMQSAVSYFWNLDTPEAVEALRDLYERGTHKDDHRAWLTLCAALAARGDDRGLKDAYEVLVELEQPAPPPTDEAEHDDWEDARDDRRDEADRVFSRATPAMIAEFVSGKTNVESPAEQQVVLQLLWKLPQLPERFAGTLPDWARSSDPGTAESAQRLLDR